MIDTFLFLCFSVFVLLSSGGSGLESSQFLLFFYDMKLYAYICTKSLQSCPTLCNAMDCGPSGSSVHGILQAQILEWVAMPTSNEVVHFPLNFH